MRKENFWYFTNHYFPTHFSIWSHQNSTTTKNPNAFPAPRNQGDIKAINAAYLSGQIFLGKINIPVLDLRHYLDDTLDMHHSFSSFSARSRMKREQGHFDNQIIWMTHKPHTPIPEALIIIDQWLKNIKQSPDKNIVENKPTTAIDQCFDAKGKLIAEGDSVWNGEWNNKKQGKCMKLYPSFKTSRMIAGDSIAGDIFKCQLQPVLKAINSGLYSTIDIKPYQTELEKIFPDGVCDYTLPDKGKPVNMNINLMTKK